MLKKLNKTNRYNFFMVILILFIESEWNDNKNNMQEYYIKKRTKSESRIFLETIERVGY